MKKITLTPMQSHINNGNAIEYHVHPKKSLDHWVKMICHDHNIDYIEGATEMGGIGYDYKLTIQKP